MSGSIKTSGCAGKFERSTMADETDMKLWATLIGWFVLIFGGGAAWGHHSRQITDHQKVIDNCNMSKLMTEDKCKNFHETHQRTTQMQLSNIEQLLNDLKIDRRDMDTRLGDMASKLDVLYGRWEQANG